MYSLQNNTKRTYNGVKPQGIIKEASEDRKNFLLNNGFIVKSFEKEIEEEDEENTEEIEEEEDTDENINEEIEEEDEYEETSEEDQKVELFKIHKEIFGTLPNSKIGIEKLRAKIDKELNKEV